MILSENPKYEVARGPFARKESLPCTNLPIQLRNGDHLSGITPYGFAKKIVEPSLLESPTLELLYLDKNKKAGKVDINQINGLKVVVEEGSLYVMITYYRPRDNTKEAVQRKIKVDSVNYGILENHFKVGEVEDFYIFGDDMQYVGKQNDTKRHFPFWRLGIYGDPEEIKEVFQPIQKN